MERLQKVMAHRGIASRRKCEEMILQKKVKVNGKVVTELGMKVDPDHDIIEVESKKLDKEEKKVYLLLNKPRGYVTTVKDPQGRKTVLELVRGIKERVYPVGRLDYDTQGLLLLTNDGKLTYELTHPKHEISKTYEATVKGIPRESVLEKLRLGVKLNDGLTAPAKVKFVAKLESDSIIKIEIHEGRNRQVRRMFEYIGHPVLELKRIQLAFLTLKDLDIGSYRHLSEKEIVKLRKMAIL